MVTAGYTPDMAETYGIIFLRPCGYGLSDIEAWTMTKADALAVEVCDRLGKTRARPVSPPVTDALQRLCCFARAGWATMSRCVLSLKAE